MTNLKLFSYITLIYFFTWTLANWPALHVAWWHSDDYAFGESSCLRLFHEGLINGRPVAGLWFTTFCPSQISNYDIYNILIRFIQGIFHCLAASIAALLILNQTKKWTAVVGVMTFLLWPFNGEAVLWRSAGLYPLGAFLGLLGVFLIHHSKKFSLTYNIPGFLLIVLAMLTNVVSALSGILIWFLILILSINEKEESTDKELIYKTSLLALGYLLGGILSYLIASNYNAITDNRAAFISASSILTKPQYFFDLYYSSIFNRYLYPIWLDILILLFVLIFITNLIIKIRERSNSLKLLCLYLILSALLLLSPFFTLLLISENNTSWRVMYLSPFILTSIFVISVELIRNRRARTAVIVLFCLILLAFIRISWSFSAEYPELFKQDLQVLRNIENSITATQNGGNSIFVSTRKEYIRNTNPYNLKYLNGHSKLSAFCRSWSAHPFVRRFSWLVPKEDIKTEIECDTYCKARIKDKSFQLFIMKDNETTCVCP